MALVGTREINNVEVEIHASKVGSWTIMLPPDKDGKQGRSLGTHHTSLDAAIINAREEIKRRQVRVAVPFKNAEGKHGTATSRHARSTDKILATVNGKKQQIGYREQTFKPDTPKDIFDRLEEIDEESGDLRAERLSLVKKWGFDLGKALDAAIAKKAEEEK